MELDTAVASNPSKCRPYPFHNPCTIHQAFIDSLPSGSEKRAIQRDNGPCDCISWRRQLTFTSQFVYFCSQRTSRDDTSLETALRCVWTQITRSYLTKGKDALHLQFSLAPILKNVQK